MSEKITNIIKVKGWNNDYYTRRKMNIIKREKGSEIRFIIAAEDVFGRVFKRQDFVLTRESAKGMDKEMMTRFLKNVVERLIVVWIYEHFYASAIKKYIKRKKNDRKTGKHKR